MTSEQFMAELAMVLNEDVACLMAQTELAGLKGWDSMGMLGVVALLDSVRGRATDISDVQACRTCRDVMDLGEMPAD